jgi:4-hydroxy-4-methyl-2-oxoglutarate aldolase
MNDALDQRITDVLIARAARLSAATLHEAAGKIGALPSNIKPLFANMRLCGRALPVRCPSGDNLWLHRAIYQASAGDVLVVDTSGGYEFGYWGEVMAVAAQARGIAGLVIDGGVRDSLQLNNMGFAVFAARVSIQGTIKDPSQPGSIGVDVRVGDVLVRKGDMVFGDADGVVILPAEEAERIVSQSLQRERAELTIFEQLKAGRTTIEIYNLPAEVTNE